MKVSVITPVYNNTKTIRKTLDSILNQTHQDLEILVVDDGSTDNSAAVIKGIKDDRIRYFKMTNSGSPSRPRNLAITKATGEYVALCDADDIWYPNKIEKQLAAYETSKNPKKIGLIVSSADLIDESGKILEKNILEDGYLEAKEARAKLLLSNFVTACSAVVPLKVMKEVGEFNEELKGVDEYDLWLKITKKYDVLTVAEPLCAWVRTGNNLSGDKAKLYLQNEKIFERLEREEQSPEIRAGHLKNLNRLLTASIIGNDSEILKKARESLKNYDISIKVKLILALSKLSLPLARFLLLLLRQVGVVNV